MGGFQEVIRNYHTMRQTQEESNKTVLHKNSQYLKSFTDEAYSGHGTDNHSPMCGKSWVLRIWSNASPKAQAPDHYQLSQAYSWLYFILNTLGFQGKLPRPRPQAVIDSAKHVPGFEMGLCHSLYMKSSWKDLPDQASPQHNSVFPSQMVVFPMWQNYAFQAHHALMMVGTLSCPH